MQVRDRRLLGQHYPAAGTQLSASTACEQDRQILRRVSVSVLECGTVEDHRVVQQRSAVPLGNRLHLLDQIDELGHVPLADDGVGLGELRVLLVMRNRVVVPAHAVEEGEVLAAEAVRHHERRHPRRVGLERQSDEVEHLANVLVARGRNARFGAIQLGLNQRLPVGFPAGRIQVALNALLHVSNRCQELVELAPVGLAAPDTQRPGILEHMVDDACVVRKLLAGLRADAEEPVEHGLRLDLGVDLGAVGTPGHRVRKGDRQSVLSTGSGGLAADLQ